MHLLGHLRGVQTLQPHSHHASGQTPLTEDRFSHEPLSPPLYLQTLLGVSIPPGAPNPYRTPTSGPKNVAYRKHTQTMGSTPVIYKASMVAHACDPSTPGVEAGRSKVRGHS